MKQRKFLFWLVLLATLAAIVIDLPANYQSKLKIGTFDIVKGLDLAGGAHLMFKAKLESVSPDNYQNALSSLKENIERRVNFFGVSEALVQTSQAGSEYRLIVELPGVVNVEEAIALVGQTAELDFREAASATPEGETLTFADVFPKKTGLTGKNLTLSEVQFSQNTGKPEVVLEFDEEGRKLFAEITKNNVNKPLAIFLDETLISAPQVREPILDGRAVISGDFDIKEAKSMVSQLRAGTLPVPIELIERRQVGPTLGEESVTKTMKAGLVGLAAVLVFMALFYGGLGVLADLGLIIYALITLALYKLIPVTVTLPGLTGFLLSVGMAVDSNILIFERMREEVKDGKPWNVAMELGFGRAWDSIRDANVCTLITCFLLFNPFNWNFLNTSGMVRGFALTLALGIFTGLFTGIVVTRTLLRLFGRKK